MARAIDTKTRLETVGKLIDMWRADGHASDDTMLMLVESAAKGDPVSVLDTRKPKCCVCGSSEVVYRNYKEQPFCAPCAD